MSSAETPPGVIIAHSPATSGKYIGTPALCIAPNGDYLASHDFFGPRSNENKSGEGALFRSLDAGKTWIHEQDFRGFFWNGLFVHRQNIYALGTDRQYGQIVIRKSTDNGRTWGESSVLATGSWHTSSVPVIEHEGRIWRAIEEVRDPTAWGKLDTRMMSAPSGADLLDARSWAFSEALSEDNTLLGGKFKAWLEGNAVVAPGGEIVNLLRVDFPGLPERMAVVSLDSDGKIPDFSPVEDFVDFPGGAKKFLVRIDPEGGGYWALANVIPERHAGQGHPASLRNTLALVFSKNLRKWETRCILLYHPDMTRHAFQYPDWLFDGEDLIAVSRTAFDDAKGGAHRGHDANFMTFHRWENFRALTRADDAPMPEFTFSSHHDTSDLEIEGTGFEIGLLEKDARAFSNRGYFLANIPPTLVGAKFTRLAGGSRPLTVVTVRVTTELRIATQLSGGEAPDGWAPTGESFKYTDVGQSVLSVLKKSVSAGEKINLPRGKWAGTMLIFQP